MTEAELKALAAPSARAEQLRDFICSTRVNIKKRLLCRGETRETQALTLAAYEAELASIVTTPESDGALKAFKNRLWQRQNEDRAAQAEAARNPLPALRGGHHE